MPPKKKRVLTSDQRKALSDASASMARAYAEARRSLSIAGVQRDEEGTSCLAPPSGHCKSFLPPKRPPFIRCARPRCGHSFFRHDVF
jgi:hypothetical protein